MPSNEGSSNPGPDDFSYKGSGTNSRGNHWCSCNYPFAPYKNSYHYSNTQVFLGAFNHEFPSFPYGISYNPPLSC
ncbi:hypothetical protein IWX90DRAFT_487588 [Phyllosticta citrichinensis]|uniref:Uncharacterized protein n=1 Tax=Phyllosticta citrichinensis TaxID=1130410 RepID=A0ABR1XRM2_9PEZI